MVLRARGQMLMDHFIIRERCPIGLRVCSLCYWRRGGNCMFPAGGYGGGVRREEELSAPGRCRDQADNADRSRCQTDADADTMYSLRRQDG